MKKITMFAGFKNDEKVTAWGRRRDRVYAQTMRLLRSERLYDGAGRPVPTKDKYVIQGKTFVTPEPETPYIPNEPMEKL